MNHQVETIVRDENREMSEIIKSAGASPVIEAKREALAGREILYLQDKLSEMNSTGLLSTRIFNLAYLDCVSRLIDPQVESSVPAPTFCSLDELSEAQRAFSDLAGAVGKDERFYAERTIHQWIASLMTAIAKNKLGIPDTDAAS